jgi:hypothetical protein
MAVVRLRQRRGPEKDGKRPEMGPPVTARGSDGRPEKPKFRGVPAGAERRKKNVPTGENGGGKLTRRKHSFRWGALNDHSVAKAGVVELGALEPTTMGTPQFASRTRWRISNRWFRCNTITLCCSTDFTATKCMVGRPTASQIAPASAASFFWRLMGALTQDRC